MPSAEPRTDWTTWSNGRGAQILTLAGVAAATIIARLPFLLRGSRFFDSDEAVEGLMARHVLTGLGQARDRRPIIARRTE